MMSSERVACNYSLQYLSIAELYDPLCLVDFYRLSHLAWETWRLYVEKTAIEVFLFIDLMLIEGYTCVNDRHSGLATYVFLGGVWHHPWVQHVWLIHTAHISLFLSWRREENRRQRTTKKEKNATLAQLFSYLCISKGEKKENSRTIFPPSL